MLCDRAMPACGRCVRLGRECTLPATVPRGRPPGSKTGTRKADSAQEEATKGTAPTRSGRTPKQTDSLAAPPPPMPLVPSLGCAAAAAPSSGSASPPTAANGSFGPPVAAVWPIYQQPLSSLTDYSAAPQEHSVLPTVSPCYALPSAQIMPGDRSISDSRPSSGRDGARHRGRRRNNLTVVDETFFSQLRAGAEDGGSAGNRHSNGRERTWHEDDFLDGDLNDPFLGRA